MTGLHELANRITRGLILAAIIVGPALMMQVQTSITIFGYPHEPSFFLTSRYWRMDLGFSHSV